MKSILKILLVSAILAYIMALGRYRSAEWLAEKFGEIGYVNISYSYDIYITSFQILIGLILAYQLIRFRFPQKSTFIRGILLSGLMALFFGTLFKLHLVMIVFGYQDQLGRVFIMLTGWLLCIIMGQLVAFVCDRFLNNK